MQSLQAVPAITLLATSRQNASSHGNRWSWDFKRSADDQPDALQRLWPLRDGMPGKDNHAGNRPLPQTCRNHPP